LSHLSLMIDEKKLFDAALATYDLNIALLVAEKSPKDPREYLPILNKLQVATPPAYQRYLIDMEMKKYDRALVHLAKLKNHFDETVSLIKSHHLHAQALRLFKGGDKYSEICAIAAVYLHGKRRFLEAGILYQKCKNPTTAMKVFEEGRLWQYMVEGSYLPIVEHFEAANQWKEVVRIYELAAIQKTMEEMGKLRLLNAFIKAGAWDRVQSFFYDPLLQDQIIAAVKERSQILLESAEQWKEQLDKFAIRLLAVRNAKGEQLKKLVEDEETEIAESEQRSEASTSTVGSRQSRISTASSTGRRRQQKTERKKHNLRPGGRFEDAALLNAIKELVVQIDSVQDELLTLLPCLLAVDELEDGRRLQSTLENIVTETEKVISKAWPSWIDAKCLPGPWTELYKDEHGELRLPDSTPPIMLPSRIQLDDELIAPRLRRNIFWSLECFK